MSKRNPDLAASVYVALICATVLVCLIGALALPAPISLNKWISLGALVGLFTGTPGLNRMAHRSRIREAVEEMGGYVIHIKRLPFWRQFDDSFMVMRYLPIARRIKHEVDYTDAAGIMHHALCRSGWFHGVEWIHYEVLDGN
jgi:hypothetical protein